MIEKIAVLVTCHNRLKTTLSCLTSLFVADLPSNYRLKVFLVDDGSTDGTSETVKNNFPQVNIIKGNGHLFWAGGMRLAWDVAAQSDNFDFYLWLNDDTILDKHALNDLFECYIDSNSLNSDTSLIVGACRGSVGKNEFSYGGRNENEPVIPDGKLQECKYINGNVVLVPNEIFLKIGNLSQEYTHTIGDIDYGLRAIKSGFKCYTTKSFIATCPENKIPDCYNSEISLKKRIKSLYSPKGLNLKEYIIFRKKFWGWKWTIFALKAYLKAIFPSYYSKLKSMIE